MAAPMACTEVLLHATHASPHQMAQAGARINEGQAPEAAAAVQLLPWLARAHDNAGAGLTDGAGLLPEYCIAICRLSGGGPAALG